MQWLVRHAAVHAPHYSLADLVKLDGRVEAYLDGLRIAGEDGWKMCEEQLAANEEGEAFVAGVLAFESGNPAYIAKVLGVVEKEPKLAGSLVSALGWLSFEQAQPHIQSLFQSNNPGQQSIAVAGMAVHRRDPGKFLRDAVLSKDALLRARAFRAAGELGRQDLLSQLSASLSSEDGAIRFSAAWSLARLSGDAQGLATLRGVAESPGPYRERALQLAVRRMDVEAAKVWQAALAKSKDRLRLAILAAGAIGDPEFIPWLIGQMKFLPLARVAGEAFTMIAGVDLAYRDLERKPPEDFKAGPTEDTKDENVAMDPDDNLPWPEPALVQKWWEKNQGQFRNGTRHLLGKPMTAEWLKIVLRDGRQRQRAAAALELAIRQPGEPLFNIAAPGFRQQQLLGKGEVIR